MMRVKLRFVRTREHGKSLPFWTAEYKGWRAYMRELRDVRAGGARFYYAVELWCPVGPTRVFEVTMDSYVRARERVVDQLILAGVWEGILNAE